jgi:ATP-dependent DNA helicase RecQ
MDIAAIAWETFETASLKPEQVQSVRALCEGFDVVSVLPTGYGKSLCYQVAAVKVAGFAIVISPLVAICSD